jgi:lipopolysaccharide export system permease protein
MKLIDRYILKEFLVPFAYCLLAFALVYVLIDLFDRFDDFIAAKASLGSVGFYYVMHLFAVNGSVPFVVMVLPVTLLLAALYSLFTLARHNELTAMRASGLSLRRLMVPFLAVGLCASVFGAVAQESLGPFATRAVLRLRREYSGKSPRELELERNFLYHTGVSRRQWQIDELNKAEPERVKGVTITQERPDGSVAEELTAERAEWLDGRWWLFGLQRQAYDTLGDPLGPASVPSERPIELVEFDETPQDFLTALLHIDFLSTLDLMRFLRAHPDMSRENRARREVDIQVRLAMPWACMAVVLVGLPAGEGGARKGVWKTLFFALAVLFGFYVAMNWGMLLGKRGWLNPWVAGWLPNVFLLGIGLATLHRLK